MKHHYFFRIFRVLLFFTLLAAHMQAEAQTLCRIVGNNTSPPGILDCNGKRVWCIEQGKEWCFNTKHSYDQVPWSELSPDQECQMGYLMALYQEYSGVGGYSLTDFQDAIWTIHTPGYSGSANSAFLVAAAQAYCNGDNTVFNFTAYCNRATLEITTNQKFLYLNEYTNLFGSLVLSSLPAGVEIVPAGNIGFMLMIETPGTFTLEFDYGLGANACDGDNFTLEYCKITNTSIDFWKDIDTTDPDAPGCQVLGSIDYNMSCQTITKNDLCSECTGDPTVQVTKDCANGVWTGNVINVNFFLFFGDNSNTSVYRLFTQADIQNGSRFYDYEFWDQVPFPYNNLTFSTLEEGEVVLVLAQLDADGNVICVRCITIILPEITGEQIDGGPNQTLPCTNGALTTTTTLTGGTPAGGTWSAAAGNPANATVNPTTGVVTGMTVAGTYTFIYTIGAGCSDQVTVTVQPCSGCVVEAGPSQTLPCTNGALTTTTTLTGFSPAGGTWSAAAGNPASATITNAGVVTGMTVAGTYTFTYTVSPGCSDQTTVIVIPCQTECDVFAGRDQVICFPQSNATISDFSPPGGTWSAVPQITQPILPSIDNNGNVTGMTAVGTYLFVYTLGKCSDTVAIVVRNCGGGCVTPKAGPDVEICQPALKAQLPAAGVGEIWVAGMTVPANITGATIAQNGMVTFDNNGVIGFFQFILMSDQDKNCADTVWVARNRKLDAGPDITICEPTSSVVLGNNGLSLEESWEVVPGNPATVTLSVAGNDVIANGLTVNGTYKFILKGQPDFLYPDVPSKLQNYCPDTLCVIRENCCSITAGPDVSICAPATTAQLTAVTPAGGTWSAQAGNPTAATVTNAGAVSGMTAIGTYRFIYTVAGCTDTVAVIRNAKPNAGTDQVLACANPATGALQTTTSLTDFSPSGGTWAAQAGNPAAATVTNAGAVSGMSVAGTYRFIYTRSGCADTVAVTVQPCTGCVQPNAGSDQTIVCTSGVAPSTTTLSAAPTGGTWTAQAGNPVNATVTNAGAVSGMTTPGTYKFIYAVTAGGQTCRDTVAVIIPNCNCNPSLPVLITPSSTVCIGDTFPTLRAAVIGLATVEWFTTPTGGTPVFTGLNYKPAGTVPSTGAVFYAQARSTDPTCPTAISTSRVSATINAQDCTKEVDLALKKSINTKIAQIGDELTYTIKVFNQLNVAATGVEVTDSIATSVQFVAGSFVASRGSASIVGNVIKWNIGNINASPDTVTLTYKVKAIMEGVHFNTAEICKTNEKDIDSTPCNHDDDEDDIDRQCFTVPVKLCLGEKVQASVPANLTNVQWFKNGSTTPIATGNLVLLNEAGVYTFTATNQLCSANGCCPIIIEPGENCCPEEVCIPFTVKKRKK